MSKLNKKKVGLCVVVVLLVSSLAYAFIRKQAFEQKVQKAQSKVEYYESDKCLSNVLSIDEDMQKAGRPIGCFFVLWLKLIYPSVAPNSYRQFS